MVAVGAMQLICLYTQQTRPDGSRSYNVSRACHLPPRAMRHVLAFSLPGQCVTYLPSPSPCNASNACLFPPRTMRHSCTMRHVLAFPPPCCMQAMAKVLEMVAKKDTGGIFKSPVSEEMVSLLVTATPYVTRTTRYSCTLATHVPPLQI